MMLASDSRNMDRKDLAERLPTDWFPLDRIPGVNGEPGADISGTEPPDTFDEQIEDSDAPTRAGNDEDEQADELIGNDTAKAEDEKGLSRTEQARRALLGVSIGGVVLAALAALVRRLLGDDTQVEKESATEIGLVEEETEPAPDAKAVAAVIGLAFQLLVRRLVGEDGPET